MKYLMVFCLTGLILASVASCTAYPTGTEGIFCQKDSEARQYDIYGKPMGGCNMVCGAELKVIDHYGFLDGLSYFVHYSDPESDDHVIGCPDDSLLIVHDDQMIRAVNLKNALETEKTAK